MAEEKGVQGGEGEFEEKKKKTTYKICAFALCVCVCVQFCAFTRFTRALRRDSAPPA